MHTSFNAITDVKGIRVGHFTDMEAASGVTVVLFETGAVAGVDVRGSAPGTRETDLLNPINLVEKAQAVVLSGGSVFGLAASDGVVQWLSKRGCGFPLGDDQVAPIVPAATLYDLGRGETFKPPIKADWGELACEAATDQNVTQGSVGAGTGALAGNIKGGVGTASCRLASGIWVGAIVAVNANGSVIDTQTGQPWEIRLEKEAEFGALGQRRVKLPPVDASAPAQNTTIGVIATDAICTKEQTQKIAQMAHDGMARAIRPAHTMFDGDTLFCLATGAKKLPQTPGFFEAPAAQAITEMGHAAADCVSRAIIHGVLAARSVGQLTAFKDLPERVK
jgi:L-aminopeptidase/D-esterase-like protein